MAQYGPDLFSSDVGGIMRDEYKALTSFGISPLDILGIFKKYFLGTFPTKNELNLFWLIMARIQVNYGVLCDEVKNEALRVIASGEDIRQWEAYTNIEKYFVSYPSISKEFIDNVFKLQHNQNENIDVNLINLYQKMESTKLNQIEEDEALPDEVRSYYRNKDFSKILIYGHDGKKYTKKRIQVIEKLKLDIETFLYKPKRVTNQVECDPMWKIGDIYAIQIDDIAREYHKDVLSNEIGKFVTFEVTGINRQPISKILPNYGYRVSIFIQPFLYLDDAMPTLEQIAKLDYLPKDNTSLFSPKPLGSKYLVQKPQVLAVSFYHEVRAFKRMKLIQLKSGIAEVSENPVNTSNTILVFISQVQNAIAFKVKKYLESTDLTHVS